MGCLSRWRCNFGLGPIRAMSIFGRLFGKQPSAERPQQQQPLQAVLAHLDGSRLPDHVYQECALATIEDNVEVGTAGCAVRAATIPPAVSRAGTSQRDVPPR